MYFKFKKFKQPLIFPMPSKPPLQILLFKCAAEPDTVAFSNAIIRSFQGGVDAGAYLATGEDLGVQLEIFSAAPGHDAPDLLDGFCHSLVVVLVDAHLLNAGDDLWDWLLACWLHIDSSQDRHSMVVVPMDDRVGRELSAKRADLAAIQLLQVAALGEHAIRPAMLALRLIHICRKLVAQGLLPDDENASRLKIFISHAKIDGLPLAHALKHQIEQIGWLEKFYDVDDIPAGANWKAALEQGVGTSLLVALRTEAYDGRPWCQQEIFWADEFATPAVVVDARTNLNHPGGVLPLDRIPTVRIPDGNLLRVLFLDLRESLRFLLFARRVEQMRLEGEIPRQIALRVFCLQPSMAALLRACHSLASSPEPKTTPRWILYPDPTFRTGMYEAAESLVSIYLPGGVLRTPQTIAATSGGPA